MKLYAFTTPDIPKHDGYLKIGETKDDIDKRVHKECSEVDVNPEIVWCGVAVTDRIGVDKMIHKYLQEQGYEIKKFDISGRNTEWVKCKIFDVENALKAVKLQLLQDEIKRQELCNKFYLEIRNWYYWTAKTDDDPYSAAESEFTLRLIVRLLLCFFLQEKGLIPKELFDENFVKENLKEHESHYYDVILRNMFFHCLNVPIADRKEFEGKSLIKDFRNIKELFQKIPFLNGGLFYEYEGDAFPLSNEHFFSEFQKRRISELDDNYSVAGIIKILSQYQYKLTVDDLFDREYTQAIDPEFIGKVFESLLTCIDADTKENRRKVTGSFYTPKEVVDYMVNEALDSYLQNNNDLLQCKILDPACGSGAFPCNIMTNIMNRIDFDKNFTATERYRKKIEILQKVIYCVDIQPIAVQITVLRLFLSLIQEIVPDTKKDNYGIEPLPNLETKFICANTLIGLKKEKQRKLELPAIKITIKQLLLTREQHLTASTLQEKKRLQDFDEALRKTLSEVMEDAGDLSHDTAELIMQWNPYNQTKSTPFFDPQYMFGITDGFDIVIGNPPYRQIKWLSENYSQLGFETFSKNSDIYCLFFEKCTNLIKKTGIGSFITSNKWLRADYGKLLKKYFIKNKSEIKIIDFNGYQIFETATVDTAITFWNKAQEIPCVAIQQCNNVELLKNTVFDRKQYLTSDDIWAYRLTIVDNIKIKIETNCKKLSECDVELNYGILTGANSVFILNEERRNFLISKNKKISKFIVPILRGKDLQKYGFIFNQYYLLNLHNGIKEKGIQPITLNPQEDKELLEFLNSFGTDFRNRGEQGVNWYNLRSCNYIDKYSLPKILYADISKDSGKFIFDDNGYYTNDTVFMIYHADKKYLKYLTGILNSKAANFFYLNYYCGGVLGKYGLRFKKEFLSQLPIPDILLTEQQPIITLVDKILSAKKKNPAADTSTLEQQIDSLIYGLYGITPKEQAIIEKSI
ncbi:MAG: Eco57I restriction-modification methylase domain-containing protein [Planctomycetaceae bacterium]|jgi:hypothetical protein|nr:Eco57I restriction-modification methylase domain-containing protein [Planctomycetaceae bacterium]